jgi:lipopolysaccharide heptosyltransferase II
LTVANCKLRVDERRLHKRRPTKRYRYVRLRWHLLFAMVDICGGFVRACLRWLQTGRGHRETGTGSPRSILIVQLDHLGDAVMTTAILPMLRRRYPKASLEVLAAPWNREVFDACDQVDAVHISRVNRFAPTWQPFWPLAQLCWGLRLRPRHFDLGIDIRGEMPLAAILWLAGVRRRVGWDCGGGGFLLTDSAKFVPGRPEMESRLALLDLIGIDAPHELSNKTPWFVPPVAARLKVRQRLDGQVSLKPSADARIVFHVGAGTSAKRWPIEHWQELLGRIIVEYGARVILVGGSNDRVLANAVLGGKRWPGVSDWIGQLTVPETAALIEQADLYIGGDSGPAHLAAAVGTPSVVLFSGTNRVRQWRPWGRRMMVVKHAVDCSPCHLRRCPLADHPCMSGITPEMVMERVRASLRQDRVERDEARVQGPGFRVQEMIVSPRLATLISLAGSAPCSPTPEPRPLNPEP